MEASYEVFLQTQKPYRCAFTYDINCQGEVEQKCALFFGSAITKSMDSLFFADPIIDVVANDIRMGGTRAQYFMSLRFLL